VATGRKNDIAVAIDLVLGGCHTGVNVFQFIILPLWLLPLNSTWAWTLVPLAFLNNSY